MYIQGLQTLSGKSKLAFLKLYNGHRLTTNASIEPGEVHNFDGSMIGIWFKVKLPKIAASLKLQKFKVSFLSKWQFLNLITWRPFLLKLVSLDQKLNAINKFYHLSHCKMLQASHFDVLWTNFWALLINLWFLIFVNSAKNTYVLEMPFMSAKLRTSQG